MSELVALHRRAVDEFARRVRAVGDDQWHLPTPNTEWDVRTLVNHLVSEDLWTVPLLQGQTLEEVGDRFDGDLLGDDPQAAWAEASSAALAAVAEEGAMARSVHVSFGEISAEDYVSQLLGDHVIHAWDLARAIGADERLDPELVEVVYAGLAPQIEEFRPSGVFGPKVDLPAGADRQSELLALTGRQP